MPSEVDETPHSQIPHGEVSEKKFSRILFEEILLGISNVIKLGNYQECFLFQKG